MMDVVSKAGLLVSRSTASSSYGVFYMTALICVAFWAMLCLQTFWYFASYDSDKKLLKFLVVFLWAISTAQTYVIVYGAWAYMIDHFGDYSFLMQMVPPFATQFIFAATATVTVQAFFVFRICRWRFSRLFPLSLLKDLAIAYLAVSLFIDIVTAIFLLALLRRHKKQTQIRSTSKIIQRLMVLAVLNMVWTTAFAICDLVTFVSLQEDSFYMLFDMPICSLYCNTLLANLNMRTSLGERQSSAVDMDLATFDTVGPQPVALGLGNDTKVSTQSSSRVSSEPA
ncbi:uncharacterized protein EDB91DRAFT_1136793, partial [Suillus paluster]|uniref:uncharacterized protein n=1 Tax=Suillus paluster TaxID=48578 RepID=UPI001B85F6F4